VSLPPRGNFLRGLPRCRDCLRSVRVSSARHGVFYSHGVSRATQKLQRKHLSLFLFFSQDRFWIQAKSTLTRAAGKDAPRIWDIPCITRRKYSATNLHFNIPGVNSIRALIRLRPTSYLSAIRACGLNSGVGRPPRHFLILDETIESPTLRALTLSDPLIPFDRSARARNQFSSNEIA